MALGARSFREVACREPAQLALCDQTPACQTLRRMWSHPVRPRRLGALARRTCAFFVALGLLTASACGEERDSARAKELKRAADAAKPSSRRGPVGVLTGQVQLVSGAGLPQYAPLDLSRRPLQTREPGPIPPGCAAANEAARTPVQLTKDGLLSGVVVAASDFTRVRERTPKTHRVVIENCRLKPPTIAATGGDTLELSNHDEYAYRPLIGPTYTARSLPKGEKLKIKMVPGGIDSILCSLGAPCGRADLIVFYHPVSAVTDSEGSFRIANFPASENVRLTAWHPLFDESETFVWLDPGQHSAVKLVLTPKTRFLPQHPPDLTAAPAAQRAP